MIDKIFDEPWSPVMWSAVAVLAMIGLTLFANAGYNRAAEKVSWLSVPATEASAKVNKNSGGRNSSDNYDVRVGYIYSVNDRSYVTDSRQVARYDRRTPAESHASRIKTNIAAGQPGTRLVKYDPEDPSNSTFRQGKSSRFVWVGGPIGLALAAFVWLILELRALAVRRRTT